MSDPASSDGNANQQSGPFKFGSARFRSLPLHILGSHQYTGTPELLLKHNSNSNPLSPVTDLALNLDSLTTNSLTPKRRISWTSETPTRPSSFSLASISINNDTENSSPTSYLDSPTFENRLLRDVTLEKQHSNTLTSVAEIKCPSTTCDSGLTLPRSNLRRLRSLPARAIGLKPFQKENIPAHKNAEQFDSSEAENSPTSASSNLYARRMSVLGISDWVASDSDSQDSGCVLSSNEDRSSVSSSHSLFSSEGSKNSFTEPCGLPPRKHKLECSETSCNNLLARRYSNVSTLSSVLADNEEEDDDDDRDGFAFFYEPEQQQLDDLKESSLSDLFTQPIVQNYPLRAKNDALFEEIPAALASPNSPQALCRAPVRRSLSMRPNLECSPMYVSEKEDQENKSSFFISRKRLLNHEGSKATFKRPDPPGDWHTLMETKRRKSISAILAAKSPSDSQLCTSSATASDSSSVLCPSNKHPLAQRSYSFTDVRIDVALQRSELEKNLTGDYSGANVLPVIEGRHPDLKTISAETLCRLVNGDFKDAVQSYTIVDCRYPYEFDGGHIQGAKNIFTKDSIVDSFLVNADNNAMSNSNQDENAESSQQAANELKPRKELLIFHCEFSSERGPKLYRFLRKEDRQANKEAYPFLYYPEMYLLEGGYKEFFTKYKQMCEPQQYKPMSHKDHRKDLSHFRAKSKSWNGDSKVHVAFRSGLKL